MGIKALHNSAFSTWSARVALQSVQKSHPGVGDSALKKGWITPVTCQFDVLLSPILVLVLCSMFFDPFEPLINVLILPANSLALFLVQKLRERLIEPFSLAPHIAVATLLRTFLAVCFACCRRCLCPNLCGDGHTMN